MVRPKPGLLMEDALNTIWCHSGLGSTRIVAVSGARSGKYVCIFAECTSKLLHPSRIGWKFLWRVGAPETWFSYPWPVTYTGRRHPDLPVGLVAMTNISLRGSSETGPMHGTLRCRDIKHLMESLSEKVTYICLGE